MTRWISLTLLLTAALCRADGIVLPRTIDPASVTIPDQQALISYADGIETLAIETRFDAAGSEFAWVVPAPALPQVSAATPGTFPTLRAVFAPRIDPLPWRWPLAIAAAAVLVILLDLLFLRRPGTAGGWVSLVAGLVLLVGLFLPALGKPRGVGPGPSSPVDVHERSIVGAYDVAVISARDPTPLNQWLTENGFAVPAALDAPIAQYVREGWFFVASRIRRDAAGRAIMTPHPLVMRFACAQPVYPMRLTAAGVTDRLSLDLYVFGPGTAAAPGLDLASSGALASTARALAGGHAIVLAGSSQPADDGSKPLNLTHAGLRALTAGATHATKLTGSFAPADMSSDIQLSFGPPRHVRPWVTGHDNAATAAIALALAACLLAAIATIVQWRGRVVPAHARRSALAAIAGAGLLVGIVAFVALPQISLVAGQHIWRARSDLMLAASMASWSDPDLGEPEVRTLEAFRTRMRYWIINEPSLMEHGYTEGDGPEQYHLTEDVGCWNVVYTDAAGQQEVWPICRIPALSTSPPPAN